MIEFNVNQDSLPPQKQFIFDHENFLANYDCLKSRTIGICGATVKRNAYGTGARRAVKLLNSVGCRHFFVATLQEGVEIRELIAGDIFVLSGPTNQAEAELYLTHDLTPVLNTRRQLELWSHYRESSCALHFDTGMNRMGFDCENSEKLDVNGFNLSLVMTHLACADVQNHTLNYEQITRFSQITKRFPGIRTSIGNSAGIFLGPEFQGDLTRPGIGLYGVNPFPNRSNDLQSVVTFKGRVVQIRTVKSTHTIGYGATYRATRETKIAIVSVGYADGIPQTLSNNGEVAFGEYRLPIIGRVTMDAIHVDCTDVPELHEDDYVEVFGSTISLDSLAHRINTIPYEILTQVGNACQQEVGSPTE